MEGYDRYGNISADEYDEYLKRGLLGSLIGKKSNEIIISMLTRIKGKDILELGCGTGRYTQYLCRDNEVICVDINPHLFKLKDKVRIIKGLAEDIEKLVGNRKFDYICSFFMTEYVSKTGIEKIINQCAHILKNEGRIIFTFITPGILGLAYIWGAKLKGIRKYCYTHNEIKKFVEKITWAQIKSKESNDLVLNSGV
ncbi:MAG: hypothetical protein B6U86_00810 [Candidatus Altiarchaeales archaeon ex4484_43]|nr:MAG: hypothetical protein B6U86_00810 [Candidatus Altiarchaeales archaeon ex4484_43]